MSNYTSINTSVPLPAGYDTSYVVQVTPGDFNGDGKLDFILDYELYPLENIAYPIRVMTGDGTGHFTDSTSALFGSNIPAAVMPRTVAVGDFNLDGRPDVYIADTGYDAVPFPGATNSLILSNGANGLINATNRLPGITDFTHSVAAVDINGDGFLDIYVGNTANPAPYFLINDGTGHFTLATDRLPASIGGPNGNIYTTNVTIFTTEAFFDADGDGDQDLFLGASRQNGVSQFLTNDGTGHFTIASTPPLPVTWVAGSDATDAQAIDLNNDGRLDLLVTYTIGANGAKAYLQALINQGGGTFTDESGLRIPASFQGISNALGIILADINGDGYKDILFARETTTPLALNDGTGHFVVMPAGTLPGNYGDNYAVGDVNGDGHLDLIASTGRDSSSEFIRTDIWTDRGTTQTGTPGDDGLMGDSRAESLSGLAGNDVIFAGGGDDTLNGGLGNDILDGGAGWDQAVFSGNYASYAITHNSNGSVTVSGPDGSDTLTNVEMAVFVDRAVQVGGVVPGISIGNASVTEGGVLHFAVTLDAAAPQNIILGYDTFAGTASMADSDYLGGIGTVTILAGQTTGTINIQTVQDFKVEPDETMSVHLLTASLGVLTQTVGTGTIVNDDVAPNISIGNASVTEGGMLHFGVTLSAAASQNITLSYDTFAGTASMANNDYLGGPGALTILAGQTTGTINVQTVSDSNVEPDETMSVHLLGASFGVLTQAVGTGTIVNLPPPNISIGNASVGEGGVLHFGVTLSAAAAQNITLGYDTFAGTASMADNDYLGGPASLTILAGQTTGTINVQTVSDSKVEPDETMSVHLLTATFGNITQGTGTGTIVNDDAAPVVPNISIGNASASEGGVLQFWITLSAAAAQNITLSYDTFAGTASMADNDYLGGPGILTILAGQTTGNINVQTVQDSKAEPDETMSVHLLTTSFGNITQGTGTGTIVNAAGPAVSNISIGNASVGEGGVLHFGVTLDQAASQNITLGYDTFAGTASMADNDYLGGPGSLTILAGQTTGTINVQTVSDSKVESDETMSVHLLAASFGNIAQGVGTGTIVNAAGPAVPNISIGNTSVTEGGVLHFAVTLDTATSQNITLGYDTFAGTASMADNDYLGGPGSLTILAGQTTGTINVQTVSDSKVEPDETMSVHLLAASFGNIVQAIGGGAIVNDDGVVPSVSIGNASVTEGGVLQFGLTLSAAASQNIALGYDTFAGTASMADKDYLGGTGTVTILAGQTTGTINVQTVPDSKVEPDETMSVHLMTISFGTIASPIGTGTIVNDDVVPNISIGNASAAEGNVLHFGVTLDQAASQNITLGYDTFAGTASMAANDYLGGTGSLTILAGQTTGTINIQTVQDSQVEPDETMTVHLLTANFGNITQGIGTGTILSNSSMTPPFGMPLNSLATTLAGMS